MARCCHPHAGGHGGLHLVHLSVPVGVGLHAGGARSAAVGGGQRVRPGASCAVRVGGLVVFDVFVSGVGLLPRVVLGCRYGRGRCPLLLAELGASVLKPHLEKLRKG